MSHKNGWVACYLQRRIVPTNGFWRTGGFLFLSVSAILVCRWAPYHLPGTPTNLWTFAWHEILHTWNERAEHFVRVAKIESWSRRCCGSYWKLASHVVQRPTHHWIRRVLHWQPVGQRRLGRPKLCWESKLEIYCRYQGLVHWEVAAQNFELWKQHFNTFFDFFFQ